MPDATLAHFTALVHKVIMGEFPIMPQPTWGQDAAYLGSAIDYFQHRLSDLHDDLAHHFNANDDPCQDRGCEWPCDVAMVFGYGGNDE